MQPSIPGFAALTSLVLLAASDLIVAQVVAPDCSLTWEWSFNTLGQNACSVAAYLMSTCNGGAFTIGPLDPGFSYLGPSGSDDADLCKCNTVVYNLLSACDGCQFRPWITWSQYVANCTKVLPPSEFPNPVPSGTNVPQWALQDITNVNLWNNLTAQAIGDLPEILAGESITNTSAVTSSVSPGVGGHSTGTPSSSSTGSSSTVVVPLSTSTAASSGKKSNTGAIAGGVAGGLVAIAVIGGLVLYFLRRPRPQAPSAAYVIDGATPAPSMSYASHLHNPQSDDGATAYTPGTPVTAMKLYDPNDPTTFPGYQSLATSSPDGEVHVPVAPYDGGLHGNSLGSMHQTGGLGGNTLANMQTARPQGYHGLPTV